MRLADNDGYVNHVYRYSDGRGKAPPNAQDTKKLFFQEESVTGEQ